MTKPKNLGQAPETTGNSLQRRRMLIFGVGLMGRGDIPSLRRGSRADLKMERYLNAIGAAWGGQTTALI